MPNSQLYDSLGAVRELVTSRLDAVSDVVPEVKPPKLAFDQYLVRAGERAARDPEFAAKFKTALAQYRALGGRVQNA